MTMPRISGDELARRIRICPSFCAAVSISINRIPDILWSRFRFPEKALQQQAFGDLAILLIERRCFPRIFRASSLVLISEKRAASNTIRPVRFSVSVGGWLWHRIGTNKRPLRKLCHFGTQRVIARQTLARRTRLASFRTLSLSTWGQKTLRSNSAHFGWLPGDPSLLH